MATIRELDAISLRDLRRLCWQAGDKEGAEDITHELLRRISSGQILPEDIMCQVMNRHRDMTTGKERSWHKGRKTYGRKTKEVEDAYWANVKLAYYGREVY